MYHELHRHDSKQNRENLQISHQQGLNEQLQSPIPVSGKNLLRSLLLLLLTAAENPAKVLLKPRPLTTPQQFPEPRNNNGGGDEAPGTRDWVCRRPTRARPSGPAGPSPLLPKRLNYSAKTIVQRGVWMARRAS
jgi:hypothetical protein